MTAAPCAHTIGPHILAIHATPNNCSETLLKQINLKVFAEY